MRKKICLNGFWDFSCKTDSLEKLPSDWETTQISVPSPYNINNFSRGYTRNIEGETFYVEGGDFRLYPEYPLHWDDLKLGFYRRNIFIPEENKGKRLFLCFDAVAYSSIYYLNGVKIGEDKEAFLPIELEITDFVRYGEENELIVGAQISSELKYLDSNNRTRLDYPQGSFWGDQIAGIWQDVWLCERPQIYIKDIFAVSDVNEKTLTVKYEYNGNTDNNTTIKFSLSRWNKDGINGKEREILNVSCNGENKAVWKYNDGDVELWDIDNPALYMLNARLYNGEKIIDETEIRIGFRTFETKGSKFILNGYPINLKNDSWHYMGYSIQTEEYARSYYNMAKDAYVNIIRLHAQPFPSFFYDIADEMGMLLVSESCIWASHCNFSYNPAFFENSKKHLKRLILRDRNHPSVVMWSPENECLPAYKVCGSAFIKDIADLEDKLYDLSQIIPELDDSRLISCDGSGDLGGRLPVNSLHYPGYECPTHREKPITIGEMGSMYYSTPDTVCMELGEKAIESFNGRLEAVALDSYRNLIGQRKWAAQVCVFNLIWYGLEPLPFDDKEIIYDDYTTPGIKPSRITPYLRTLNAGAQENLPEYIPNPVFKLTQKAYMPVRFFVENAPSSVWSGENISMPIVIFNDDKKEKSLTITINGAEKTYPVEACGFIEDILTVKIPENIKGDYPLTLELYENETLIFSETLALTVYNRVELESKWESLGVMCISEGDNFDASKPVIDCRCVSPYASFTKTSNIQHIFAKDTKISGNISFDKALNGYIFDEYLNFNAKPLYFNGKGVPVVLSLTDAESPRILCGVDLNKYNDEPFAWVLRIQLGELLKNAVVKSPKPAYFFGNADSNSAAMLNEIRCEYDIIDKNQLLELLKTKQNRLLIADGKNDLGWLKSVSKNNFSELLIINLEKEPDLFSYDFKVTDRKAFNLSLPSSKNIGVYSNSLYGLSSGGEEILSPALLRYNKTSDAVILGIPDIDWRMWNHNAEHLKTVSILKSEKTDNSQYAALSCHKYAGSDIYFSQLSLSTRSRRAKNLNARLISSLGGLINLTEINELEELLFTGIYGNKITKALQRPLIDGEKAECVNPGLNRIENKNGKAWNIITETHGAVSGIMAVYAYSPQDRTDLLLNPDTVDMYVEAEKEVIFYLNGEILGQGKKFTVTSVIFNSGWNKLVFYSPESQTMPDIRFKRINLKKLDLKFGLYDGEIVTQNMQKATLSSDDQPNNLQSAISGSEKHWRASVDQRENIDLGASFTSPILCKALYFSCSTSTGERFTPYRFKLLAGNSQKELTEVYRTGFEEKMSYIEGKVFIRLDDITASDFKIVLTDNALKPWIVSNLTFLS